MKFVGLPMKAPEGRPDKAKIVLDWRANHPEGKKADCIRDTGLSKPTVYKWWDSYDNYVSIDGKYLAEHGELDKFFSDFADEYWREKMMSKEKREK